MQLSELSSQNFRNLSPDAVSFGPGVTLITGENAQGKSNLLEAAALVCGQRSFRGAAPADMARDGASFSVAAAFSTRTGSEKVCLRWSREGGREFLRGEKPASFRDVSLLAPAVFLAPEHREILNGGPSVRRRFLDRLVLGLKPAAGDDLSRYARALSERNVLLARARQGRGAGAPGELEAWTEELSVAGSAVRRHRIAALAVWDRSFQELARTAFGKDPGIRVEYSGREDSAEGLRLACERLRTLERRRGHTMAGPHRDDLLWTRDGRALSTQASAGEAARTVALVKLAEWTAVAREAGEPPLFAADDFDAGLAEGWVEEFFDSLPPQAAVLLTTTAPPSRWARRAASILEVRDGRALPLRSLRAVGA